MTSFSVTVIYHRKCVCLHLRVFAFACDFDYVLERGWQQMTVYRCRGSVPPRHYTHRQIYTHRSRGNALRNPFETELVSTILVIMQDVVNPLLWDMHLLSGHSCKLKSTNTLSYRIRHRQLWYYSRWPQGYSSENWLNENCWSLRLTHYWIDSDVMGSWINIAWLNSRLEFNSKQGGH